jgi:hypothetical protein
MKVCNGQERFWCSFKKTINVGETSKIVADLRLAASSIKYPEVFKELQRIGARICKALPADFEFTFNAIHINRNVTCPPHVDARNMGRSILVSFGKYTGSKIVVQRSLTEAVIMDSYCRPILFNGSRLLHWNTDDLEGTKYSLVFYTKS